MAITPNTIEIASTCSPSASGKAQAFSAMKMPTLLLPIQSNRLSIKSPRNSAVRDPAPGENDERPHQYQRYPQRAIDAGRPLARSQAAYPAEQCQREPDRDDQREHLH